MPCAQTVCLPLDMQIMRVGLFFRLEVQHSFIGSWRPRLPRAFTCSAEIRRDCTRTLSSACMLTIDPPL
jgi:hypothetical protein